MYVSHAVCLFLFACVELVAARNYYEILGIAKSASPKDIKQAFRKLALRYHPDKNLDDPSAEAKFIEIAQAYEVLSDPVQRLRYDEGGAEQQTFKQKPFGSSFNFNGDEFFRGFNDNPHFNQHSGNTGGGTNDIHERLRRKHAEMHAEILRKAHGFGGAQPGGGGSFHEDAMRRHRETIARMQQQQQPQHQQHATQQQHGGGKNCKTTTVTRAGMTTTTTVCS